MSRSALGVLLVVGGSVAFGLMGLFGRWTEEAGMSPELALLFRFGIAGVALAAWMLVTRRSWPRGRTLLALVGMGAVLYVCESTFFFHALRHIPSGMVSLLLYLYPAMVTLTVWLSGHERPTWKRGLAVAIAMAGMAMVIYPQLSSDSQADPNQRPLVGVLLGLGTAFVYSIYILIGGTFTRRAGAVPAATVVILSATAVLGLMVFLRGDSFAFSSQGWWGVTGLAIPSTFFAITAILGGLALIGPVRTSTLATVEPLTTAVVGMLYLHERLNAVQWVGGGLIVVAAILAAQRSVRDEPLLGDMP